MNVSTTLSAIAANRRQFFALLESLEQCADCQIDEKELQSAIDADFAGRDSLTRQESHDLLMKVARQKNKNRSTEHP